MGKIQSKRSVDITSEGNRTREENVTGKLEKIEDIDERSDEDNSNVSPQNFKEDKENMASDVTDNRTYSNEEKCSDIQQKTRLCNARGDQAAEVNANKEEGISPISVEIKSKKDKVKKKWSFRSISFGKKDIQIPCKSEQMPTMLNNAVTGNETNMGFVDAAAEKYKKDESSIDSQDKNVHDEQKQTPGNVLSEKSVSLKNENSFPSNSAVMITEAYFKCSDNENINDVNKLTVPITIDIKLSLKKENDKSFTSSNGSSKVKVGNSKNSTEITYESHAPLLPCTPPPYQVPIISLSPNVISEISKSDDFIMKTMEIEHKSSSAKEHNVRIEKKNEYNNEYNNPQEENKNTAEDQVTQNETLTQDIDFKVSENSCNGLEICNEKMEKSHELIKQIEISSNSFNGTNEGLKKKNLLNISSFPKSHIKWNGNSDATCNEISEYQSQHDQQIATTIVEEISETAVKINEDLNKEGYSKLAHPNKL